MKVNFEIDCTPEEARRFLGLPDVSKANEAYVESMTRLMKGVGTIDQLQEYANQMAPMGQLGIKLFQQFLEGGAAMAGVSKKKPGS